MKVAFATKTWGEDWQKMLGGAYERKWQSCKYPFEAKFLILNNGITDEIQDLLTKQLNDVSLVKATDYGNVYLNGEKSAIQAAINYDYLCYLQGDAVMEPAYDWITPGLKVLNLDLEVAVISPASFVNTWHNKKNQDHYCSDQAWMIRVSEFLNPKVYSYLDKVSDAYKKDYPNYGGDSFEKMIGCYLKATGRFRQIIPEGWVMSPAY